MVSTSNKNDDEVVASHVKYGTRYFCEARITVVSDRHPTVSRLSASCIKPLGQFKSVAQLKKLAVSKVAKRESQDKCNSRIGLGNRNVKRSLAVDRKGEFV